MRSLKKSYSKEKRRNGVFSTKVTLISAKMIYGMLAQAYSQNNYPNGDENTPNDWQSIYETPDTGITIGVAGVGAGGFSHGIGTLSLGDLIVAGMKDRKNDQRRIEAERLANEQLLEDLLKTNHDTDGDQTDENGYVPEGAEEEIEGHIKDQITGENDPYAQMTEAQREYEKMKEQQRERVQEFNDEVNDNAEELLQGNEKITFTYDPEKGKVVINEEDPQIVKLKEYFENYRKLVLNLSPEEAQIARESQNEVIGGIIKQYLKDTLGDISTYDDENKREMVSIVAQVMEAAGAEYWDPLRDRAGEEKPFGYNGDYGSLDCIRSYKFIQEIVFGHTIPNGGEVETITNNMDWREGCKWDGLDNVSNNDVVNAIKNNSQEGDGIFFGHKTGVDKYGNDIIVWEHVTTNVGNGQQFNANSDKDILQIKNIWGSVDWYREKYGINARVYVGKYNPNKN